MSRSVNRQAVPPRRARSLARSLADWYEASARDLPWRHSRDPYAIWVSEIMLQQTRVESVAGRWERFLARFPDLASLAAAPESEVLAEWAGLGYYRRARSLHAAARQLREHGIGSLPRSAAELRLLPGFGEYTAGAVASIAFGERVCAVDGNVERVLARLLALPDDPARGESRKLVRGWATALLDRTNPAVLNQALMELGATICTPRNPACDRCPWEGGCRARGLDAATDYPRRPARRATEQVLSFMAVARGSDASLLFRRRPDGGHNAGLWELPTTGFLAPGEEGRAREELVGLGESLGRRWIVGAPLAKVRHSITHHRIDVIAHAVSDAAGSGEPDACWMTPDEARKAGITAASARILDRLPTLI